MANTPQARKRARQAEKRRLRNRMHRSRVRTAIKKVLAAIQAGDRQRAEEAYRQAVPIIDSVARKGVIHPNKAARHKSRLSQHLRRLTSAEA